MVALSEGGETPRSAPGRRASGGRLRSAAAVEAASGDTRARGTCSSAESSRSGRRAAPRSSAGRPRPPIPVRANGRRRRRSAWLSTARNARRAKPMRPPLAPSVPPRDQALQFFCGESRLPLRVAMATCPPFRLRLEAQPSPQRIHGGIEDVALDRAFAFQAGTDFVDLARVAGGRVEPPVAAGLERGDLRRRHGQQSGIQRGRFDAVQVAPCFPRPQWRGLRRRRRWRRPRPARCSRPGAGRRPDRCGTLRCRRPRRAARPAKPGGGAAGRTAGAAGAAARRIHRRPVAGADVAARRAARGRGGLRRLLRARRPAA